MLLKIFLLKRKNSHDLSNLDIYSYPEDIDKKENNEKITTLSHIYYGIQPVENKTYSVHLLIGSIWFKN